MSSFNITNNDYAILRTPRNRHWTSEQIQKAQKRMIRFCSSKAHLKSRNKKALERYFKRLEAWIKDAK